MEGEERAEGWREGIIGILWVQITSYSLQKDTLCIDPDK